MKLLFLTPLVVCLPLFTMDQEQARSLEKAIKSDIYTIMVQEMGLMRNWSTLASGNQELKKDLEALSRHLHGNKSHAQTNLNAFCARWKMNPIKIDDAIAENKV